MFSARQPMYRHASAGTFRSDRPVCQNEPYRDNLHSLEALLRQPLHDVAAFVQQGEEAVPRAVKARLRIGCKSCNEAVSGGDKVPSWGIVATIAQINVGLADDCRVHSAGFQEQRMVEVRAPGRNIAAAPRAISIKAKLGPGVCRQIRLPRRQMAFAADPLLPAGEYRAALQHRA